MLTKLHRLALGKAHLTFNESLWWWSRRMSDAVEGAEVILYGVSKGYKESANCRLEANYGHQQG